MNKPFIPQLVYIEPNARVYGEVLSECEVGVFYLSNEKSVWPPGELGLYAFSRRTRINAFPSFWVESLIGQPLVFI